MIGRDGQPVRFVNIAPPPDNGCEDCKALNSHRAFCPAHRAPGKPCLWCGGRGFRVLNDRWVRCKEDTP